MLKNNEMTSQNSNTDITHELMNIIDESKEEIPEGLYLRLCNTLQKKHNEDEDKEDFYKISYIFTEPEMVGFRTHNLSLVNNKKIIKLNTRQYNSICYDLKNMSFARPLRTMECLLDICNTTYIYNCSECNNNDDGVNLIKTLVIVGIEKA